MLKWFTAYHLFDVLFSMLRLCCVLPLMHSMWKRMWICRMRIRNFILLLPAHHGMNGGCRCSFHCSFIDELLLSTPSHRWFVDLNQIPFKITFFCIFLFMKHESEFCSVESTDIGIKFNAIWLHHSTLLVFFLLLCFDSKNKGSKQS